MLSFSLFPYPGDNVGGYLPIADIALRRIMRAMSSNPKWLALLLPSFLSGCGPARLPATPLFAGVAVSKYSDGTKLIQDRLRSEFPTGSSQDRLVAYLSGQGLLVERPARLTPPASGLASFKTGGFPCGSQVRVGWMIDSVDSINTIDVLYGDTGCP